MMMSSAHPWMLTAPWYRWAAPGVPAAGRKTKPEIQKYAGFEFARELLAEPQRSLIWKDDDYVHRTLTHRGLAEPGTWLRERTQVRKLYRPTHGRNYLVVVELHGDAAGLPSVDRRDVAEAGFVIRRLRARVDPAFEAEAHAALSQVAQAREQVAMLERNTKGGIPSSTSLVVQAEREQPVVARRQQLLEAWTQGKLGLDQLAAAGAFGLDTEAWIPDPTDPLRGAWQRLRDPTPCEQLVGEAVIPLYPLNPDPRDREHSAAGRTLYFGVIPLGGREAEASGAPRFDDQHLFEIRCFVRRQPEPTTTSCLGRLVWSEPTIGYRIAADRDPEGTANLPISITLPTMRDVQALARAFPELRAGPKSGLGQVCLVTLFVLFMVALVLVFAFLPVIVFLLQLFFLLRLEFRIAPVIDLELDLAVELKAALDVQFEVGGSLEFGAPVFVDAGITTQDELERGSSLEYYPLVEVRT